jgi:hypothetical protein
MKKKSSEYDNFDKLASSVLKVPHNEVKDKMEKEQEAKKRKKSKQSSASREANDPV